MVVIKAITSSPPVCHHFELQDKVPFSRRFQQAILSTLLHPLDDAGGTLESFIMRIGLSVDPYFKTVARH